jgi:xylulokinase
VGIHESQLPKLVPPGSPIGTILPEVAARLGLSPDTLIVNGGMDQSVGAIGAGNIQPGIVSETTGAALAIQATIDEPFIDASAAIPVYMHSVPSKFLFVPVCPTAGMAFKWLRDAFFQDMVQAAAGGGTDSYDHLTALAAEVPPGSEGLVMLPHLMGAFSPHPNPKARGSFTGFTLGHTRAHFARALLEGVAFMLRQNLEMLSGAGIQVNEIRSTGGGARSSLWNQIKADVCALPIVTLASEETALLGDAILAGVACGLFASLQAGCQAMVRTANRIVPGENSPAYAEAYKRYCALDDQLVEFYQKSY